MCTGLPPSRCPIRHNDTQRKRGNFLSSDTNWDPCPFLNQTVALKGHDSPGELQPITRANSQPLERAVWDARPPSEFSTAVKNSGLGRPRAHGRTALARCLAYNGDLMDDSYFCYYPTCKCTGEFLMCLCEELAGEFGYPVCLLADGEGRKCAEAERPVLPSAARSPTAWSSSFLFPPSPPPDSWRPHILLTSPQQSLLTWERSSHLSAPASNLARPAFLLLLLHPPSSPSCSSSSSSETAPDPEGRRSNTHTSHTHPLFLCAA